MGNSCTKRRKAKVSSSCTLETEKSNLQYRAPAAIDDVMGVDVEREQPGYLYAQFCLTRLVDGYKTHMFPDVAMDVSSFREDVRDYLVVVSELYHDLCFEERALPSKNNIDPAADVSAKMAISVLAFQFFSRMNATQGDGRSGGDDGDGGQHSPGGAPAFIGMKKLFAEKEDDLVSRQEYENCYGDTLKMLIRDLERKETWQLSTVYSNKEFQELLKEIEPVAWKELADDSVEIQVPTT